MDAFNAWVRKRMSSRGSSNFVLFDTSQYNNNHVQTLNTWQAFCNDTTCDDPTTCKLARQAADQRNAKSNAEEKLGEHTDALVELMRYNKEIEEQQEEIKRNREELEIKNARKEAAQKGLATKRRNKEKRDEQLRLTEHICAELEALRSSAAKKKEKEKIAKKNQLVSRICDALDDLKDLDEKNKERFERIQQEILDIASEDEQNEEGEQAGAKRQKTG
ncbi:hypothetical protein D6C99_04882 [Aureobasidium pullulans]|nr:hypothetical protein D6C99_04882 [Aureobasidium pullulans]